MRERRYRNLAFGRLLSAFHRPVERLLWLEDRICVCLFYTHSSYLSRCSRNGAGLVPFFVAINPAQGPGGHPGSQPPLKFQQCIPALNTSFEPSVPGTVFTMGYVDTNHGKRAARAVLQDIDTYAQWHATYRPNGIYFDRTPSDTSSSELIGEYAQHVRDVFGGGSIVSYLASAGYVYYTSSA
jgi:hypothetical protein